MSSVKVEDSRLIFSLFLFIFIFTYFLILKLGLEYGMTLYVTVTNVTIT